MPRAMIGIDCGSSAYKGVLLRDGAFVAACVKPAGWNPKETARSVLDALLRESHTHSEDACIAATGYGRAGADFAGKAITEITCHARGAEYLLPGTRTVIDIGGQDSKVISVKNGRVLSFQMNDKCAAGTGRFLEMSAHRIGVDLTDFPALLKAGAACALTSMCAVFADSEIVSLLASGKSREEVAGGIVQSVAARVAALAARIDIQPPVLLTGGLADLEGLRLALERQIQVPVTASPRSRYAGAIGAACQCEEGMNNFKRAPKEFQNRCENQENESEF
jgi:predicted CoA-substrate-specific enzyme activase